MMKSDMRNIVSEGLGVVVRVSKGGTSWTATALAGHHLTANFCETKRRMNRGIRSTTFHVLVLRREGT